MPVIRDTTYVAPYVLSNRHLATILPVMLRLTYGVRYERQRIDTLDGDFLDLDWLRNGNKRLLICCHGLEGSSRSPYVAGMAKNFARRNYDVLAWNYRGCSGSPNRTLAFYHPGQTDDFEQVVRAALERGYKEIYLAGFSLGGAYILRYLGEKAANIYPEIKKAVAFSTPVDLEASTRHMSESSGG
ncbi:MAG: alpha/beta fold hydrolase, partial [Bacteroidota bacterium]